MAVEELATDAAGDGGEADRGAGAIELGERGTGTLFGVDGAVSRRLGQRSTAPQSMRAT